MPVFLECLHMSTSLRKQWKKVQDESLTSQSSLRRENDGEAQGGKLQQLNRFIEENYPGLTFVLRIDREEIEKYAGGGGSNRDFPSFLNLANIREDRD